MTTTKLTLPLKSRLTKQRQLILDLLRQDHSHPTVDDLYKKVKAMMPGVSLATVYRNLNWLTKLGVVREISMPDQVSRWDGGQSDHDHFICHVCKKIYDIPKYRLEKKYLSGRHRIGGFKLELSGICEHCQHKEPCLCYFGQKGANIKSIKH